MTILIPDRLRRRRPDLTRYGMHAEACAKFATVSITTFPRVSLRAMVRPIRVARRRTICSLSNAAAISP